MQDLDVVKAGSSVIIAPRTGAIPSNLVDHLSGLHNVKYLDAPHNVCVIADQTVSKITDDIVEFEFRQKPADNVLGLSSKELVYLQEELDKAVPATRTYYTNVIQDFRVGDRVIYNEGNYVVVNVSGKKDLTIQKVELLGYASEPAKTIDIVLTDNGQKGKWKKWFWTEKIDNPKENEYAEWLHLRHGVLLYDNGPEIDSLDSIYLKYKTLPDRLRGAAKPEIGLLVSVYWMYHWYRYVIEDIREGELILRHVSDGKQVYLPRPPPDRLTGVIDRGQWVAAELEESSIELGSWKEQYRPPR